MPTPRPIIAARIGDTELTSANDATSVMSPRLTAEPDQRGADRQAHRDHRAEGDQQHDDGDEDADDLLPARFLLDRLAGQVAAELEAHRAVAVDRRLRRLQPGERRLADLLGGLVVLDVGVADGGVLGADLQRCDLGDVRLVGDVGHRGLDRGRRGVVGQRRVVGRLEHELGRGAGHGGEVGLEDVEGLLRLDAGDVEGVGGLAAPGGADAEDGDGQHRPREQDQAAPTDRGAAEPVEEGGHVVHNVT